MLHPSSNFQAAEISAFPMPFNFYRLILDSDHLHFGYWPENKSHVSLEEAQVYLQEALIKHLPKAPARLLDVGCGLGVTAAKLATRGYQVTAIAPSETLIRYARTRYNHTGVQFTAADFMQDMEFEAPSEGYDAIIFQESLQYLRPLDSVFDKARQLLKLGGLVLLTDEVCHDLALASETAVHPLTAIKAALAENGMRILQHQVLDDRVGRTCRIVLKRLIDARKALVNTSDHAPQHLDDLIKGWQNQESWYASGQFGYRLIVADKNPIFLRCVKPGDENRILPLFNRVFNTDRTLAHWYWKYRDNPWEPYITALSEDAKQTLIAQYCGYPVPFRDNLQGADWQVYQAGDTMTNPAFRQAGIGHTSVLTRTLDYFCDKFCWHKVPFKYGFNTGAIRKLGERFLKYQYISPVPCHQRPVTPSSTKIPQRLTHRLLGLRAETVVRLTPEYDDFFSRASRHYGLLTRRSAEYLNWRYLACPDNHHHLLAVRRRGRLVGWGVFAVRDRLLIWGDALFDGNDTAALNCLLNAAVTHCHPSATHIQGWFAKNPPWWSACLRSCGFTPVPEPNQLAPCFRFFDTRLNPAYFEDNWYYTMGDSDLF